MALKVKEREAKIKALRKDLEEKLEEQLPPEMLEERKKSEPPKIDSEREVEPELGKKIVEALLLASSKPLTVNEIRKSIKGFSQKEVTKWTQELKEAYDREGRSFEVLEIAGGFEIATRKEFAPWIVKMELQKKQRQATQSALETLAILAYKQPITRVEIEELRGVDVSGVLNTLMEKGFVKISGKKEIPGRPFLYSTTEKFLEHFGLNMITDLPSLEEIRNVVENAVKKEDLLGTHKVVDVPQEGETAQPSEAAETQTEPETQEETNGSEPVTQEN